MTLQRTLQVSKALGGIASRLVGHHYLGLSFDAAKHAEGLRETLGSLKGPLMKIAQFLSTIPGALPEGYGEILQTLQTNAPPMGPRFVLRRLQAELGTNWASRFESFEETPRFAASLGQVHQARHLNGEKLACKLQYPNMEMTLEADLKNFQRILAAYESWAQTLKTEAVQQEIRERLLEELDYLREAKHCRLYAHIFQGHSEISVPTVYEELTTPRLLSLSWMEGVPILELPSGFCPNALSEQLFKAWYYPFYEYGIIHADPHPGNMTVCPETGRLNLLDFGCVRIFTPAFVGSVVDLYRALLNQDQALLVHAFEGWGFQNLSKKLIEVITQWARLLYDPLLEDRVRPLQSPNRVGWEMIANLHQELKTAGQLELPREFVFMDRASVVIGSVIMRLQGQANWHRLFEEMIASLSVEKMEAKQTKALQSVGIIGLL